MCKKNAPNIKPFEIRVFFFSFWLICDQQTSVFCLHNKITLLRKKKHVKIHVTDNLVLCSIAEIEAKEACDWLRATGFPQYAQLYEGEPGTLFLF